MGVYRSVLIGYAVYIAVGFGLLSLPLTHKVASASWLDHFFTASSAVSTTGLTTVAVGETYNRIGQTVILLLIQIGGIGYMTLGSFAILATRERLPADREDVAQQVFTLPEDFKLTFFLRSVVCWTIGIEAVGGAVLYWRFRVAEIDSPLWNAIFHSVSSFCTAGFSPFPDSLQRFQNDTWVLGTMGTLAMLGALGFLVLSDVVRSLRHRPFRPTLTSQTIVVATFAVLAVGAGLLFLLEPAFGDESWQQDLSAILFQSVNALTTTGFSSVPMSAIAPPSVLLITLMMICGASPSGTGGGVKSTSIAAAVATTWAMLRGHRHVRLLGREIPEHRIRLALASIVFYLLIFFAGFVGLVTTERLPIADLGFEAASALGTVGLSREVTGQLSTPGQMMVILMMYIGRIGPLTFGLAIAFDQDGTDPAKQDVPSDGPGEPSEEEDLAVT